MRRHRVWWVFVLSLSCPRAFAAPNPSRDVGAIVDASLMLARKICGRLPGRDLFFSPASISVALAMVHAGARGATARQLAQVLAPGLPPPRMHPAHKQLLSTLNGAARGKVQLDLASALWGQTGHTFDPSFVELIRSSYSGGLEQVDFAQPSAAATINRWVRTKTRGMIVGLIPGTLDEQTRLMLTSAVYFKGAWQTRFPDATTRDAPFNLAGGKRLKVPMMHVTASLRYRRIGALEVLELPYRGGQLSMLILLPRAVGRTASIESYLDPARLRALVRSLPRREVEVFFPRFSATLDLPLMDLLRAMGIKDAFTSGANFSGMDGTRQLFLTAALHRARVEVNEEGTEAAAVTAFQMEAMEGESHPRPPVSRADRPFVYLIRERRSGSVLFVGRLMQPPGALLGPEPLKPRTMD